MSTTTTTARKRKSDASNAGSSKKTRTSDASVKALIADILADPDAYDISDDKDDVRRTLVEIANYARRLEINPAPGAPVQKTAEQLEEAAAKVKKAAVSGLKKQMTWKPSCKAGTAKFSYDGVCADPAIMGVVLGCNGPPTFKMKKIPAAEFEDLIGHINASVRYDHLRITSADVTVRWNAETGEFKFSGTYGK